MMVLEADGAEADGHAKLHVAPLVQAVVANVVPSPSPSTATGPSLLQSPEVQC